MYKRTFNCQVINSSGKSQYNIAFDVKVQQSPGKYVKTINRKVTPCVTHICDIEENEPANKQKIQKVLSEMQNAMKEKGIIYALGYSNVSFELWLLLHKGVCNGSLNCTDAYLPRINKSFNESF